MVIPGFQAKEEGLAKEGASGRGKIARRVGRAVRNADQLRLRADLGFSLGRLGTGF